MKAADLIFRLLPYSDIPSIEDARKIERALAEAGYLVTEQIQAVLDAAVAIRRGPTGGPYVLAAAVDDYLNSPPRPKGTP